MPPTIEIIAVTYQQPGPLRVLVQSFLNQTAANWKLTVIHDGPSTEFDAMMEAYAADPRVKFWSTATRHNDWGHSLRDEGIKRATGDYLLQTNGDNYYVPRFVEFVNAKIEAHDPDVVIFNMVHSHDRPGGMPLPAYSAFTTEFRSARLDIGAAVVRTSIAKAVGFTGRKADADQAYFAAIHDKGPPVVAKIERILFVHN